MSTRWKFVSLVSTFPPNGMPVVNLTYRNDDGGPGYGKDSYLVFTAPSDGKYYVRIRDVLGHGGDSYAYRMTIAEPAPRFTVSVSPANPMCRKGGRVPITVTATHIDGFDGEIEVQVKDLPEGFQATRGVILPGHTSVALTLSASETASLDRPCFSEVTGSAVIGDKTVSESELRIGDQRHLASNAARCLHHVDCARSRLRSSLADAPK